MAAERGSEPGAATVRAPDAPAFSAGEPIPGLLLAFGPKGASPTDRVRTGTQITIGRSGAADWTIRDEKMSGTHLRVRRFGESFLVEDLGSTNGTYLDGERLVAPAPAYAGSVVRAGETVLVCEADLRRLEGGAAPSPDLSGRFHSPAIAAALDVAAGTGRHVLLVGESGTGKELAARRLLSLLAPKGPAVFHNCARFASVEEAEATLYGVARGVFSGVDARLGLLEEAEGGALFLDELHVLPLRVQQSLLRFVEDREHARIGTTAARRLTIRLVFGTNVPLGSAAIADDLVARLHVVGIPSLADRRGDVPEIFLRVLVQAARAAGADPAPFAASISADHAEALCLADHAGRNVRALESIAQEIVSRRASGDTIPDAVRRVFGDRLARSPVAARARAAASDDSHYEQNRERIVAAFHAARGNVSVTVRSLRASGLVVSRRWLAEFLRKWGVRA